MANRSSEDTSIEHYANLAATVMDEIEMLPAGINKELALSLIEAGFSRAVKAAAGRMYPEEQIGSGG